jgi:hypothetical protein
MEREPQTFPSCSKLQFKKNFLHFEEWQDKFRRYCLSETANLLNKEKKTERGGNLKPIEEKYIFKIYFSYIINMTEGLYVRINSEMKQKESRMITHLFSHVIFFLSEFELNSWELQVLKLANFYTGLVLVLHLQHNW